jgi:hypothetical protein
MNENFKSWCGFGCAIWPVQNNEELGNNITVFWAVTPNSLVDRGRHI